MTTNPPKQMRVPLSSLKLLPEVQSRVSTDLDTVKDYVETLLTNAELAKDGKLKDNDNFSPIEAVVDGDNDLIPFDGFHRIEALRLYDPNAEIDVLVYPPYEGFDAVKSAIFRSCLSNMMHGKQRSKADKIKAVKMYLSFPGHAEKTDVEIAQTLKVSRRNAAEGRDSWKKSTCAGAQVENDPQNSESTCAIAQVDEPEIRIRKNGRPTTITPKSSKKTEEAVVNKAIVTYTDANMLCKDGQYDGRKVDHYIDIIPKYGELFIELAGILEQLPGLIGTADQQQTAKAAIQALSEPFNRCRRAVEMFQQGMLETSSGTPAQEPSSADCDRQTPTPIVPIVKTPPLMFQDAVNPFLTNPIMTPPPVR